MNRSEAGKLGRQKSDAKFQEFCSNRRASYEASPKQCPYCNSALPFELRRNKFCNHSCACKFTNNRLGTAQRVVDNTCLGCNELIARDNSNRYTKFCKTCISESLHRNKISDTNDTQTAGVLRRILLEKRTHQCEMCKLSEWNSQPIGLEVDHVDGNYQNNLEANLRLLCRNCHAQTPTYGIKNIGNGRHLRRKRYAEGKSR